MPANKKQHFVPQLLQGFFSKDSKTIGCYHIESGKDYKSTISNTAQKDWLYRVNDADKTTIEHMYGHLEGNAKPIIVRLQDKDLDLSSDDIDKLFIFVVAQLMRTPKAANAMKAVLDFCIEKKIEVVCREVKAGIRDMSNLPMQATIAIPRVAEHLSGESFLFIWNETGVNFLLADNPACIISPVTELAAEKKIEDRMFRQEPFSGYMLYMPLGPKVGIICFDDDYYDFESCPCIEATLHDVKTLNNLEIMNASDIIMHEEDSFCYEDIQKALEARNTERWQRYQETIYTPIEVPFTLTGLNMDENVLLYKIHKFAVEKGGRPQINVKGNK